MRNKYPEIPNSDDANDAYLKIMDWFTKQMRFAVQKNKEDLHRASTARIMQDITYSGRNKIVCVFTLPYYFTDIDKMYVPSIKYGKLPKTTIHALKHMHQKLQDRRIELANM